MSVSRKIQTTVLALTAIMVALAGSGLAQEKEVRAKDVVVTATRTEHTVQDVPSSVSVIRAETLREAPKTTIADALQDVPGVEVFDQSVPGAKRLMIRGESGARVLILIDGQKISEQKSMDGAALLINPNRIERLEVVKGPASILYGSEAIGGVVNIITKKGGDKPVSLETNVSFDSSTDGFNEYLSAFGGMNGFSYRLSGAYSDHGDRHTPNGVLDDTSHLSRDVSAFLGYDLAKASFGLSYDEYWANVNSRTPDGMIGKTMSSFDVDLPKWERKKLGGFAEVRDITSVLSRIRLDMYHQDVNKDMVNIIGVTPSPVINIERHMQTKNDQSSWGGVLQADLLPHTDHALIFGYDLNIDQLDSTSDIRETVIRRMGPPPHMPRTTFSSFDYEGEVSTHALYLQDEWTLPADFVLTLGARQTWVQSELSATNNPKVQTKSISDSHPVFSVGLTWSGLEDTTLRALFSQGYRFPNLQQLYIGTQHGDRDPTFSNPDLEPETSNNYEVGVRYDNGSLNADLGFFFSQSEDYITTQAVPGGKQYTNVDSADTHGAELALSYRFQDAGLTPYVTGTWLRRHYEAGSFKTWKTGHPEFMGRGGVRYDREFTSHGVSLFADLYVRAAAEAKEKERDGRTETYDSWQTLNLSLGTTFGDERQHYLSLNLLNIMDQTYQMASSSLEEAGAHAVLTIGTTF